MTPDEVKAVEQVYRTFLSGEEHAGWDEIDTQLEYLDYLEPEQLYKEATVQLTYHKASGVVCSEEFCNQDCMASDVVDAVEIICTLYNETGSLHEKNRYILQYYLALGHLKMIVCKPR